MVWASGTLPSGGEPFVVSAGRRLVDVRCGGRREVGEDFGDLPIRGEAGDAGVVGVVGDACGDVPEFDVGVVGMPAKQRECLGFVESVRDHQRAFGLFDRGPGFGGLLDCRLGRGGEVALQ